MKISYNLGTSSKGDNLHRICSVTVESLKKRGHSVYPINSITSPCIGCRECVGKSSCVLKDCGDYMPLIQSDVILIFSPIYFFGICSSAKKFLDRLYGIGLVGKILCFVTISGSPSDSRYCGVDLIDEMAQRTSEYCGCHTIPTLNICTCDGYVDAYECLGDIKSFISSLEVKYHEISG